MIFILPMILLILFGALIKYKKVTWLISGYNTASPEKKEQYDIDKLCKYMGNFLFVLAGVFFVMAVFSMISGYSDKITIAGFFVLVIAILTGILYMNTGNRIKKQW